MLKTDTGWRLELERGPDWVFLRLYPPRERMPDYSVLADEIWALLDQSFTYRVVLELDQIPVVQSYLLTQLVLLSKRIGAQAGMLRLCGLSPENQRVIRICRLDDCLPTYENRSDAVMGHHPGQPR